MTSQRLHVGIPALTFLILLTQQITSVNSQQRFGAPSWRTSATLRLLAADEVQKELDIESRQKRMIEAIQADTDAQLRSNRGSSRTALHEVADNLVSAVLADEQNKRLQQMRIQFEGFRSFERPDIAKQFKLSDDQVVAIKKLRDDSTSVSTDKVSELLATVLDDDQQAKWIEITGEPFVVPEDIQRFRGGRRGQGRGGGSRRGGGGRGGPQRP